MAQTAVEWLKTEIEKYGDPQFLTITWTDLDDLINQGKQMEKEQITSAYQADRRPCSDEDAEQYYNVKFGNK